mgnify:CR=1 FL=1
MRKFNPFQWLYGGLAVFLNEQINPALKSVYFVVLAVIYIQIILFILDDPAHVYCLGLLLRGISGLFISTTVYGLNKIVNR